MSLIEPLLGAARGLLDRLAAAPRMATGAPAVGGATASPRPGFGSMRHETAAASGASRESAIGVPDSAPAGEALDIETLLVQRRVRHFEEESRGRR